MKTLFPLFRSRFVPALAMLLTLVSRAEANNVSAALEGSLLVIAGDNLNNQITVAQSAVGDITITGANGTLVNGLRSVRFPGVQLNAAEMLMGAGNDIVTLRGIRAANDLFINLGPGADRLTSPAAAPITIGANLTVEAAEQNDVINLAGTAIGGDARIDGGLGVLNATLTNVGVYGNLELVADESNDVVSMTGTTAGGVISVETKGGADRITATNVGALLLGINTDIGADTVSLSGIDVAEDLGVFTGPGADSVLMMDVVSLKNIIVSADSENDRVAGTAVSAALDAVFEGGAGSDRFEDYGITGGVKKDVKEFEVFLP
jgi:hypothetical protein